MNELIVYTHKDCLKKFNGINHPERKERLEILNKSIKEINNKKIIFKESKLAKPEIISLVHPKKYIDNIFNNIPNEGLVSVEKEPYADTFLC